jgi:uncharacterized protein involved in exopolysaccharide biosynthesis
VKRLSSVVDVSVGKESGIVSVAVRDRSAKLSALIARRLVDLVNRFNSMTRQSRASAERRFTEARLATARAELRTSEESMELFLEENRDFSNAPQLTFRRDRLQRDLGVRQQIVAALAQSYEQARIDEVRNTPVITIVQLPEVPVRPDSRGVIFKSLLGALLGLMFGVAGTYLREVFARGRVQEPERFEEASQLLLHAVEGSAGLRWIRWLARRNISFSRGS